MGLAVCALGVHLLVRHRAPPAPDGAVVVPVLAGLLPELMQPRRRQPTSGKVTTCAGLVDAYDLPGGRRRHKALPGVGEDQVLDGFFDGVEDGDVEGGRHPTASASAIEDNGANGRRRSGDRRGGRRGHVGERDASRRSADAEVEHVSHDDGASYSPGCGFAGFLVGGSQCARWRDQVLQGLPRRSVAIRGGRSFGRGGGGRFVTKTTEHVLQRAVDLAVDVDGATSRHGVYELEEDASGVEIHVELGGVEGEEIDRWNVGGTPLPLEIFDFTQKLNVLGREITAGGELGEGRDASADLELQGFIMA